MKNHYVFARQVADGCFDEVKRKENEKRLFSILLFLALLSTTFLTNIALYIATFIAFILQILYVMVVRESKILNAKAQESHKLRLYFSLFKNHSIYTELSDLHTSLQNMTIEKVKSKKYEDYDDTTPHEINRVRKLYWILQENCFYNKTLHKLERNLRAKILAAILIVLVTILAFHPYIPTIPSVKNLFIEFDIYFLPRFAFIAFSSFIVIELIDEYYDFHNGSNEMGKLYAKIEKLSKKPKMDELLTIISNYYAILRQTPNISDRTYNQNKDKLKKGWEHIYKSKPITKLEEDIIDTLKIFAGLLCDTSNWCVIGSTSRFLQGDNIKPNDIDILTDEQGIVSIRKYCSAFIYEKPIPREEGRISSIYGYLMINNISIDVMANLMGKIDDTWETFDYENTSKKQVKYDCLTLNLREVEVEKDIDRRLNNEKTYCYS